LFAVGALSANEVQTEMQMTEAERAAKEETRSLGR